MTEAKNADDRSGAWGWPPFVPEQFLSYWPVGWKSEPWMAASVDFLKEMASITAGTSSLAPDSKDWRFKDKAWSDNPLYQRWVQAYLAMCAAVEAMIPDNIPLKEQARAELVTSIVTSMFAPTNTLVGNPAALARTWETKGDNLAKGFQNFVRDLGENGGMPAQVDDSSFEVGRNLAVTPGKIVLRTPMFELIHYAAVTDKVSAVPVLLVPPQIGRFYFTDLAPGRSFAEYTVSQGINYFAISWRNPSPSEREWGLDNYLEAAFEAVKAVAQIANAPKINIVGFCAGGILSAILASWLEARNVAMINSLTLCVTMLDFSSDAALGAFRFPAMLSVAKAQSEFKGVLSGDDLHKVFTLMRPNDLLWNYWVNNYLMGESPPAFDILAWNKDGTNMPARLHNDFLDLFETNPLIEPGRFRIAGETIDLGRIKCDAFVVGAVTDHLTPWKACYKAVHLLGGDAVFALSNGGHIAALVNPPGNPKAWHKLQAATAPDAGSWETGAEELPGSWWESWTKWVVARSGKAVKAPPTPGSNTYHALADAPGQYVKESPAL